MTAFFTALPIIIASFFGGALADRLGHRRMSIVADLASGLAVAAIPLLSHLAGLAFWQLLLLVFGRGLASAPGEAARLALLPELADLAGIRLERVTAAFEAVQRGAVLLGAPLAGALIGAFSPSTVLWGDAAVVAAPARYLTQVTQGLRVLWGDRLIRAILVTALITNLLDAALGAVVIPVYVKAAFGSALALGLVSAALGAGALIGSMAFLAWGHRLPRRLTLGVAFTLAGTRAWVLAPAPPLPLLLGAMVVLGLALAPVNPLLVTTLYRRIPAGLRARAMGALIAGVSAGMPLGGLLGGALLAALGTRPTLVLIGACYVATTLGLFAHPASREMDTPTVNAPT